MSDGPRCSVGLELRDYQVDIIEQARALMRQGKKTILIQSPTGSGKTVLTGFMMREAARRSKPAWFGVHRIELVEQSVRTLEDVGLVPEVVAAGYRSKSSNVLAKVVSIPTLSRRGFSEPPELMIWDECHHIVAGTWLKLFRAMPDTFHIGCTATPERLDGTGLVACFGDMIKGPSVSKLMADGYLSKYRLFSAGQFSTDNIHVKMGDYDRSELRVALEKPAIVGNAVDEYERRANGLRSLVFCVSVEASKAVADEFHSRGHRAVHLDGDSSPEFRKATMDEFRSAPHPMIICNCELFGEGLDVPGIECVQLLRPTMSLAMYLQQVGRSLRPGKEQAIILDHVQNYERHGLPDDEREWSLDSKPRRKREKGKVLIKTCPECMGVQRAGRRTCAYCGAEFPVKSREIDTVDGELEEVKRGLQLSVKSEIRNARTYEDFLAIAFRCGYKPGWAWYRWKERKKRQYDRSGFDAASAD